MGEQVEAKIVNYFSFREVGDDIHIVKEVKYKDGVYEDNIRVIKDFKRPFWVTKPIYQKYIDKLEYEDLNRVDMFTSTQSSLYKSVSRRLGSRYIGITDPRRIKESPYVYGLDTDSRTILKHVYNKKLNRDPSPDRIGFFDIEVDTLKNDIILISLITKGKVVTAILKSFVDDTKLNRDRLQELYTRYVPDDGESLKNNVKLELKFFDDEIDMIRFIFQTANYSDIDTLAAWNVKYDITEILDKLQERQVDPASIFHYDEIPEEYKYFEFREGRAKKITEAGREMSLSPEDIWNTIKCTANYTILDAMAAHRFIRVGTATTPGGYSLDNILKKEGISGKLKFDDTVDEKYRGLEWHIMMVKSKPLEYIIYNIWDVMSLFAMEMKTNDLSISLPLLSGISHSDVFNSGPRKIVDAMFIFYLEHKKVLGVKAYSNENDKILGLDGWVITLISHYIEDSKNKYIKVDGELTNINTNIRTLIYDLDITSAYPSATAAANISTATTHREIYKIGDLDKDSFKKFNIDISYGRTNAIEYCTHMFNMPSLYELIENVK